MGSWSPTYPGEGFRGVKASPWRGTGQDARIHERLLQGSPELRATMLVDTSHIAVRGRHEQWGYAPSATSSHSMTPRCTP
ncbi:hypothetical protein OG775_27930 [Streptomyces platensis]|uniref:hypothetical protein n=1 Tax=Streptomyces platensis TaxID=58346 RepID=UPI00224CEBC5|nr:hypothetical protein [Streptomyces platensis]MCX4638903.1 hypothetical protein [Streptomyces platensis]